jgi:hypothetical protein
MTNKGLRIHNSLFYPCHDGSLLNGIDIHFVYLGCVISGRPQGIFLKGMEDVVYVRVRPNGLMEISDPLRRGEARTIYVARHWDHYANDEYAPTLATGVEMQLADAEPCIFELMEASPPGRYDQTSSTILVWALAQFLGFLKLTVVDRNFLPEVRHQVIDFITVFCSTRGDVSLRLLVGDQTASFMNYTKSIWNMDLSE